MSDDGRHQTPGPAYAAVFLPPGAGSEADSRLLIEIAQAFSPRYECHRDNLISIDVKGLERLFGSRAPVSRAIGDELMRAVAARGTCAHVAIAATRMTALILAHARPGLTVTESGHESTALSAVPLAVLNRVAECVLPQRQVNSRATTPNRSDDRLDGAAVLSMFMTWGVRTLGELAALPAADLTARIGRHALVWQAMARGEDLRPLVPTEPEERFAESLELEWPIEELEPLSFVLTRLLEPLSTRLERRDRGAAVLHVTLDLVTRDVHARHLQLPSPIRDVRTLRTLALLDIEAHPPAAAVDRITIVIDPTPGRIVQHTLFTRALPTPEQLSTLLARLGAVMGQDRVGSPVPVDTYRPGAFTMQPFVTEHHAQPATFDELRSASVPVSALRRCRHPVPARVAVKEGRPVRVTSDRNGFAGGSVVTAAGPWRTSGQWWAGEAGKAGRAGEPGGPGRIEKQNAFTSLPSPPSPASLPWDRTEWEVALSDGAMYRVFHDEMHDAWFIDGMFD